MNAKIVEHAGIRRSRTYHMVNTRTQFTIPKGDGEPPNFFLGFKLQATSDRRQATSVKQQASSVKRQAASVPAFGHRRVGGPTGYKLLNRGPWIKFHGSWSEGLD